MTGHSNRKGIAGGFGLAALLVVAVAGCGGKGSGLDDAVVVPDPTATAPTVGSSAPAGGAASTAAPTSTAAKPSGPVENVKAEGWGTLKGQITFNGTPPEVKDLAEKGKAPKDPDVCAKDTPIKSERLVVDAASKGVKNVIVYIPKPSAINPEAKSAAATATVEFDQQNCTFKPHVLAVMTGATIQMKNSDAKNHNIDSKLKNNATNPNISPGVTQPFVTQASERSPGPVICDIHPWMSAYWMVVDSPYFAVTDAKGNFEIKNVPAGTQKVVIWQESYSGKFVTPASGEGVNIKADGETVLNKEIDAGKILPE